MKETENTEEGTWDWSLGSFAQTEEGTMLTLGRVLSDEEREEWQRAASFIRTLSSGSNYPQAAEAMVRLADMAQRLAAQPESERSPVDLDALGPAFAVAARLLVGAANNVISQIDDFPISSEHATQTRAAVLAIADDARLRACKEVAATDSPPVVLVADESGFRLVCGDNDEDGLVVLQGGAYVVQLMHAQRLAMMEEPLRQASLKLRTATAEVLDGPPTLIRHKPIGDGALDLGAVQFDDLALARIAPLQRMLSRAHQALAEAAPVDASPAKLPEEPLPPLHEPSEIGRTDDAESDVEEGDTSPVIDAGILDLRSLVMQLTTVSGELERAWSSALDALLTDETVEETRARWGSLLRGLQQQAETDAKQAEETGFDPTLPGKLFSGSSEAINLVPEPEQAWKQAEVAYLHALEKLVAASTALTSHPIQQVRFAEGQAEFRTLWDSGAFARIKALADFVVAIHEERDRTERHAFNGAPKESDARDPIAVTLSYLRRAREAFDRGDPEAAVLHLNSAFVAAGRSSIESARLEQAAPTQELIAKEVEVIVRGETVALATATLVAVAGFSAAARLLLPSEPFDETLHAEEDPAEGNDDE